MTWRETQSLHTHSKRELMTKWHWMTIALNAHDFVTTWCMIDWELNPIVRDVFTAFGPIGFLALKVSNILLFGACWCIPAKFPAVWRSAYRAALVTITVLPAALIAANNTIALWRLL